MIISLVAYITRLSRSSIVEQSPDKLTERSWHIVVNILSECLMVINVFYYLWIVVRRMIPGLGFGPFISSLGQVPEIRLFLATCALILLCIPLRLLGWQQTEDFVAAIIMFNLPLKMLFFCRASRSVGSFVVMIYKIVVNDLLCFVVFMMIFVAGFSQCKFEMRNLSR